MFTLTTPKPSATIGDEPDIDVLMRALQQQLRSTHRQILSQRIAVGLGALFVAMCVCIAGIASLDWIFELSTFWRATSLFVVMAASAAVAVLAWKRWMSKSTLLDTAAKAEQRLTKFGQRLRTTLDYQLQQPRPAAASPSLLNSLYRETYKYAERTEWAGAVDRRPLFQILILVGAVVLTWLVTLGLWPEFRIAAGRALLLPLEYSTVTYAPQTQVLRLGESITITANVVGRPIYSAQVRFRSVGKGSDWVTVPLLPIKPEVAAADAAQSSPGQSRPGQSKPGSAATENVLPQELKSNRLHGVLSVVLDDLVNDTEFHVLAGPRSLPPGLLRILQPLTLSKVDVRIAPPAYTHRADQNATTLDLRVLEGSDVDLKLQFNRQPSQVTLQRLVQNSNKVAPETAAASTGNAATEIAMAVQDHIAFAKLSDLRESATFIISAQTADGMSLEQQQLNIRVQPDLKPRVAFIQPDEELIVTATTEVPMVADAEDDLGLYKTGILYQIGTGPLQTLIEVDADGSTDGFRLSTLMMLEEHPLSIRDGVTYYAYAEDNYFDQPRRTTTALRYIDIRPYKIAYEVDDSDGGAGASDGSSVTLEELISRQRQTLTQSFAASQQAVAKEILAKIINGEEELKSATAEFAAGMAERGAVVPALDEALTQMDLAIQKLSIGHLTDAVTAEQRALAALISARQNLRNKLTQSNSQSASARRKFDRQQRQKLRMPEKKKADQQEQLAQTRQQLEQLAERERQWSKQAQQCVGSTPGQSQSQSQTGATKSSPASSPESSSAEAEQPQAGPSETPSPAELAAAQEKLQADLAALQGQLERLDAAGQAARNHAGQAGEIMQKGLEEMQKENGKAAASEGERAAAHLEQLADHLAAMNTQDFGQQLEQAQQLAHQLSAEQSTLDRNLLQSGNIPLEQKSQAENGSKSSNSEGTAGLARDQQAIAAQTEMLAELLERLQREAVVESVPVQRKLEQASAENSPRDIAAGMRRAADDLEAQRPNAASPEVTEAAKRLQELSELLDSARGEFAQPQLKELLALEEQLAQLQEQLKKTHDQGETQTAADQKWRQLETRLDKLAAVDRRIAEAMQHMREGPQGGKPSSESSGAPYQSNPSQTENSDANKSGVGQPKPGSQLTPSQFTESNGQPTPEGFYSWRALGNSSGMREVSKVLQAKIQEAILTGALLDADQPVPPAYKELVEKYYRALSDDLR